MGTKRRPKRKSKSNLNKNGFPVIIFIVAVFCLVVGVYSINLKKESNRLAEKKESLEEQIAEEEQRTKELEELEKYTKTKKYMEEVAREKLGLVYPDEILVQPSNK